VLLDHGYYVDLPDELRRKYCQMWCAFVLNDRATAERIAVEMAGPRGPTLLPALLSATKAGAGGERAREASLQHGLQSLGDLANVLHDFPPEVVEVLRMTQTVRHVTQVLGLGVAERLGVNATCAVRGLSGRNARCDGAPAGRGTGERWRELQLSWKLAARIHLLRALLWSQAAARQVVSCWRAVYSAAAVYSAGGRRAS